MQFLPDSIHQRRLFAESPDVCRLDQFEHLLSLWHSHYSSVADETSRSQDVHSRCQRCHLGLNAPVQAVILMYEQGGTSMSQEVF